MIETYILQNLAAFAECGTLLKTSEKLHVTQPAITKSFKKLEMQLGIPLFSRTKNTITLNANGKLAVKYARQILSLQTEMESRLIQLSKNAQHFSIGAIAPAPLWQLTELIKKKYDKPQFKTKILDNNKDLLDGLHTGKFDFAILNEFPQTEAFYAKEFFSEHLYVFLPQNHRLAGRTSLHLAELAGETFIMFADLGFWSRIKKDMIPDAKFITQKEMTDLREILSSSTLPGFVTDFSKESHLIPAYATENRVEIPLLDDEVNVTYYIVCPFEFINRLKEITEQS
ncbi:LysR family transcriptional regulator [Treponema brennaborense]|uniref:Transcriptional regulator, LysR family n=1 Tax=Treponema brennaborense (strain DSM 12168 / CIP 105900 / DD5/3) TaxID=906968 RepID=F4LLV7_TREBD|nr:LysR family transcriptional regulator [Treponema brennaborense]AEE15649.1 transcriptional regulator, LysR family [Treponema brennaborense DSM 12168]